MTVPHIWNGEYWWCQRCGKRSPDPCTCECHEDFCLSHHRREPDLPGDYKVCGECLHVWRTEQEFREDEARAFNTYVCSRPDMRDMTITPEEVDPTTVYSCPLCTHDF